MQRQRLEAISLPARAALRYEGLTGMLPCGMHAQAAIVQPPHQAPIAFKKSHASVVYDFTCPDVMWHLRRQVKCLSVDDALGYGRELTPAAEHGLQACRRSCDSPHRRHGAVRIQGGLRAAWLPGWAAPCPLLHVRPRAPARTHHPWSSRTTGAASSFHLHICLVDLPG